MADPEELSRGELIAMVRDQGAQLADQAVELERLRAELEQIKRLLSWKQSELLDAALER